MHFSVNPGYGTPRLCGQLQFVDASGPLATVTAQGFGRNREPSVTVARDGQETIVTDLDTAALHVARLLHEHHDHSLVVASYSGRSTRMDEEHTADVYPPGAHPRVIVVR